MHEYSTINGGGYYVNQQMYNIHAAYPIGCMHNNHDSVDGLFSRYYMSMIELSRRYK